MKEKTTVQNQGPQLRSGPAAPEKTSEDARRTERRRRRNDFKVRKYNDRNRPRWKFVVTHYEAGKRQGKLFETKAKAKTFADEQSIKLTNEGREGAEFPTALRVMAQDAVEKMLELLPKSSPAPAPENDSDEQRRQREEEREEERKQRMADARKMVVRAVDEYVTRWKASERSCGAAQLVKEMVAAKERDGLSSRHTEDLRSRLKIFAAKFDGQMVATITSAEIDDWLRSLPVGPVTRNHYRSVTVQAFNFAIGRGYATHNPAAKAAEAKEPKTKPGILTVEQATALLVNASPEVLPYIAIGLFAGLRRAELERLDWSEIDFDSGHIEVTAEKSKSKMANRFITLQPNLREWLMPHRQHKGSVTPQENFRELFDSAREAAGIDKWPGNALRHSFASYHVAHFKDAKELALEMGHTDSGMLFNHYRALVKPKEAERYWNIRPLAATKKVVAFKA